jgi:glycosyltransferase involved in cell wall biosynthesis
MAIAGRGRWRVTAIAPKAYCGDLRRITLEPLEGEACALVPLGVRFDRAPHLMMYAGLRGALSSAADVVHCWEEPYVAAGAQVAKHTPAGARLVYGTFQNLSKSYPPPFAELERRSLDRAAGWIAFGRTVENTLVTRAGYDGIPHRVIPPGVDVERFTPDTSSGRAVRRRIGWPEDALVVGYLGRFTVEKGIHDLCDALDRLRSPWHGLFVGGGALQTDLERFRDRHPGRVHIANGVSHADVPQWLNAMTVLSAPSRTTPQWREQFGRMLIEAMACGIPVVATTSGEMPHVVDDAARVVPEQDPAALADAIATLLADDAVRNQLSAAGIARARKCFAWATVARQHLDFFDALVESNAR